MTQVTPKCPVCKVELKPGFLIDPSHGANARVEWVEGEAKKNVFGSVTLKNKERLGVVSHRCPQCGWLVSFAN